MLNLPIDMGDLFDLDFAFTMPLDDSAPDDDTTEAARRLVDAMPAAVMDTECECIVCMEGFRLKDGGKRIPCGHVFHEDCISEWILLHNSCPLCRRKILV